jgi:hypothetical protein
MLSSSTTKAAAVYAHTAILDEKMALTSAEPKNGTRVSTSAGHDKGAS